MFLKEVDNLEKLQNVHNARLKFRIRSPIHLWTIQEKFLKRECWEMFISKVTAFYEFDDLLFLHSFTPVKHYIVGSACTRFRRLHNKHELNSNLKRVGAKRLSIDFLSLFEQNQILAINQPNEWVVN